MSESKNLMSNEGKSEITEDRNEIKATVFLNNFYGVKEFELLTAKIPYLNEIDINNQVVTAHQANHMPKNMLFTPISYSYYINYLIKNVQYSLVVGDFEKNIRTLFKELRNLSMLIDYNFNLEDFKSPEIKKIFAEKLEFFSNAENFHEFIKIIYLHIQTNDTLNHSFKAQTEKMLATTLTKLTIEELNNYIITIAECFHNKIIELNKSTKDIPTTTKYGLHYVKAAFKILVLSNINNNHVNFQNQFENLEKCKTDAILAIEMGKLNLKHKSKVEGIPFENNTFRPLFLFLQQNFSVFFEKTQQSSVSKNNPLFLELLNPEQYLISSAQEDLYFKDYDVYFTIFADFILRLGYKDTAVMLKKIIAVRIPIIINKNDKYHFDLISSAETHLKLIADEVDVFQYLTLRHNLEDSVLQAIAYNKILDVANVNKKEKMELFATSILQTYENFFAEYPHDMLIKQDDHLPNLYLALKDYISEKTKRRFLEITKKYGLYQTLIEISQIEHVTFNTLIEAKKITILEIPNSNVNNPTITTGNFKISEMSFANVEPLFNMLLPFLNDLIEKGKISNKSLKNENWHPISTMIQEYGSIDWSKDFTIGILKLSEFIIVANNILIELAKSNGFYGVGMSFTNISATVIQHAIITGNNYYTMVYFEPFHLLHALIKSDKNKASASSSLELEQQICNIANQHIEFALKLLQHKLNNDYKGSFLIFDEYSNNFGIIMAFSLFAYYIRTKNKSIQSESQNNNIDKVKKLLERFQNTAESKDLAYCQFVEKMFCSYTELFSAMQKNEQHLPNIMTFTEMPNSSAKIMLPIFYYVSLCIEHNIDNNINGLHFTLQFLSLAFSHYHEIKQKSASETKTVTNIFKPLLEKCFDKLKQTKPSGLSHFYACKVYESFLDNQQDLDKLLYFMLSSLKSLNKNDFTNKEHLGKIHKFCSDIIENALTKTTQQFHNKNKKTLTETIKTISSELEKINPQRHI